MSAGSVRPVASGTLALILGPVAMFLPKRPQRHLQIGIAYQISVAVLFVSAIGLTATRPVLWGLDVIVAATWVSALAAGGCAGTSRRGWLSLHVSLMCGSYIALTTAFLVVNLGPGSVIAWALPTVVGGPVIAWRSALAGRQRIG
jgi:hypothetical protein